MKIFSSAIFFSMVLVTFNANAGVALHCENDSNGSVLCSAIATGETKIEDMFWVAVSPAVILQDDYSSASFGCLSGHGDDGTIVLGYATSSEQKGAATFSLDCAASRVCTVPPPDAPISEDKPRPNGAC